MAETRPQLSHAPALRSPRVRKLLWAGAILAVVVGLMAGAPPTRTEPLPWTGWVAA